MKTMQNGNSIVRIKDSLAGSYLKNGYKFVPKEVWKINVRDAKATKKQRGGK